ncbi:DUF58 domain-containing protein [Vibrio sp. AK197]
MAVFSTETSSDDPRIHVSYSQLVRLQAYAGQFSFLPSLKAKNAFSGRHQSTLRGRGLNFEELRHYQLGDDIRNLDWKVTMRTGKPHVRSYTEEKDRNIILCVDQRSNMFFSSVEVMKSVVAAETAALCAWQVLKEGDRIGMLLMSDEHLTSFKPTRSQHQLLNWLQQLTTINQALSVSSQSQPQQSLPQMVQRLARMHLRSSTIVILSDWLDASEDTFTHLKHLQQHNDVLSVMITDPLEARLPELAGSQSWVLGDGEYQLNLSAKSQFEKANDELTQQLEQKREWLLELMVVKRLPYIELNTSGSHLNQLRHAIGGRV